MKLLICGLGGTMGQEIFSLAKGRFTVCGVDPHPPRGIAVPCAKTFAEADTGADCVLDFSTPDATEKLLNFTVTHRLPLVIATTGQSDAQKTAIRAAAETIPVFFAPNYSVGIVLLTEFAVRAAEVMDDAEIEIVETHHDRKTDAPSGTALAVAEEIKRVRPRADLVFGHCGTGKRGREEIGIHSLRMGNVAGEHEVILATPYQTIRLKHEAHDRALYAEGALAAARFLIGKQAGLYNMYDLISAQRRQV